MNKEELNQHFVAWFYNTNWVENYNRNGWMRDHYNNSDADQRHYWMLQAFIAGFELQQQLELADKDRWFDQQQEPLNAKAVWPFPGE